VIYQYRDTDTLLQSEARGGNRPELPGPGERRSLPVTFARAGEGSLFTSRSQRGQCKAQEETEAAQGQ